MQGFLGSQHLCIELTDPSFPIAEIQEKTYCWVYVSETNYNLLCIWILSPQFLRLIFTGVGAIHSKGPHKHHGPEPARAHHPTHSLQTTSAATRLALLLGCWPSEWDGHLGQLECHKQAANIIVAFLKWGRGKWCLWDFLPWVPK